MNRRVLQSYPSVIAYVVLKLVSTLRTKKSSSENAKKPSNEPDSSASAKKQHEEKPKSVPVVKQKKLPV